MKLQDYLKLGTVGIRAHKRRVVIVVGVVSALVSVLVAGCLVIQGVENVALVEMTRATEGKVLLSVRVDGEVCGDECDEAEENERIRARVREYGGEIVGTEMIANADGGFYQVEGFEVAGVPEGVPVVLVSMGTAARWLGIGMDAPVMNKESQMKLAERIRSEAVGKIVETEHGGKYYIAGFLSGGALKGSLAVSESRDYNSLDLVLGAVSTGSSQSLVIGGKIDGMVTPVVVAGFTKVEDAERFYQDEENYCTEMNRANGRCGKNYRYNVVQLVSEPLTLRENMQGVWRVYKVVSVILMVIALAIEISTYVRLVQQDKKTIALYRAMGATRGQIRRVYGVYLLVLSLMVVGFAMTVGLVLALVVSMVNAEALTQAFTLGFGVEVGQIWLIGWNAWIWGMMGVVLLGTLVILFCGRQFGGR